MHRIEGEIIIYGGGVAGALLAHDLSRKRSVVLIEPRTYFEVPMAMPRALVRPDFADRSIMPFAQALPKVRHISGTLSELAPDHGLVDTPAGQIAVHGRVAVLATGARHANNLVHANGGTSDERRAFYATFHARLLKARRIVIVGGGPIGVEIAGEISENFPDKHVTLVEQLDRLLSGTSPAVAEHAAKVLRKRGVELLLGETVTGAGKPAADVLSLPGELVTGSGRRLPYDVLLWCTGGRPEASYLTRLFPDAVDERRRIRVAPDLRVHGTKHVFALGDITDLPENKLALNIINQVPVAAANIEAVLDGKEPRRRYRARTGSPLMVVTLGSQEGVAHLPAVGVVTAGWLIRTGKARDMLVPRFRKGFGL